jgi:hypothetical protein
MRIPPDARHCVKARTIPITSLVRLYRTPVLASNHILLFAIPSSMATKYDSAASFILKLTNRFIENRYPIYLLLSFNGSST